MYYIYISIDTPFQPPQLIGSKSHGLQVERPAKLSLSPLAFQPPLFLVAFTEAPIVSVRHKVFETTIPKSSKTHFYCSAQTSHVNMVEGLRLPGTPVGGFSFVGRSASLGFQAE